MTLEDKQSDHPIWVNRSFDEVMWNRVDSKDVLDWFHRCIEDFPKHTKENRVSPIGTPYVWLAYDFDEINEWYAKWLQQFDSSITTIKEKE